LAYAQRGHKKNLLWKNWIKVKDREAVGVNGKRRLETPYKLTFTPENGDLRPKNAYFWDDIP
jgi:hypothetical protein